MPDGHVISPMLAEKVMKNLDKSIFEKYFFDVLMILYCV